MRIAVQDRRTALVAAAVRVIARDGVAAASTRAVVAEAGMSLASLHYAFESREALLAAVVEEVTGSEQAAAEAGLLPIMPGDDLTGVIRSGLDRYLDLLAADPERELALLDLAVWSARTSSAGGAQYRAYLAAARSSLTAAARATGTHWTVPLDEVARLLVLVTDGLTLAWLADRDSAAARRTAAFAATSLADLATSDTTEPPDAD